MGIKPTIRTWKPAEDCDEPFRLVNNGREETLMPLATCTDEDGEEIIAVAIHHVPMIGDRDNSSGITELRVLVPGMCGHYGCGATSIVSLN